MNEEFDISDGSGTLVFCIDQNRWRGSDEWESDGIACTSRDLFSFNNGELWKHNQPGARNTFFGQPVKSFMGVVANLEAGKIKTFQSNSVESNIGPSRATFRTELPESQASHLKGSHFRRNEGVFKADLLRNGTGELLFTGERMRGPFMYALYEFDTQDHLKLRFINIAFRNSAGHEFI